MSEVSLPTFDVRRWALGVRRLLVQYPPSVARQGVALGRSLVRRPPSASPGIALVMVLGILSVMVIMAVAFAISMRTERVAAGNYADSVRARQLVQVGLARALDDLARNLGTNGLMSAAGGTNYPTWDVTNSFTTNYVNTSTNKLCLLTGEATNFVPRALWSVATNADYLGASNHWLPLDSLVYTNNVDVAESNRMGRVKYLILNCSGLLDANFAGGIGSTRGMGTNPSELAIGDMPEFASAGAADTFLALRDGGGAITHYRYETLDELAVLNASSFNGFPSNFIVYSHAPTGYWSSVGSVGTGIVNLAGSVSYLAGRKDAIIYAFTNAGFLLAEAGILYSNLIDYVDSDSLPFDFSTSVEPVPMINEVVISNVVTDVGGGNSTMATTISLELWYPFVSDNADTFTPQYKATFTDLSGTGFKPVDVGAWQSLPSFMAPGKQSFAVKSASLPPFAPQATAAGSIRFRSTIDVRVSTGAVPQEVDRVYSIILTNENAVGNPVNVASTECLDPRFNGSPAQWSYPVLPTLGRINTACLNYFASYPDLAGETNMYVANKNLRTVGELGYLSYASWKTVKLYGTNLNPVLDHFAMGTNDADSYVSHSRRGLVNPNSRQAEALSAVFASMPVDDYLGGSFNLFTMDTARGLYAQLTNSLAFAQGITNLSDIGHALTNFAPIGIITFDNELKKESLFRNTCGLLSVRQNLFTIIIEAHVASGGNIPLYPVKQRAVALVWRDPYTGEMFVRSIKWLRD